MRMTSTPTAEDARTSAFDADVPTLDALYQREFAKMVRIATLVGGSQESAEEIVQDAFVRVHQRFDSLDNPGAYLRSCVVNGCRDRLRRRMRFDERLPVLATDTSADFEAAGSPDVRVDMARALAALPLRSRLALVLKFYGGWTVPEISDALDLPAGTVKTVIHRGLARLRKEIEP
jgi:RNA polymerase sigma factor (sigma-70 family)